MALFSTKDMASKLLMSTVPTVTQLPTETTTVAKSSVTELPTPEQLSTTSDNTGVAGGSINKISMGGILDAFNPTLQEVTMDFLDAYFKTEKGKVLKKNIILHYLKTFWWIVAIVGIALIWTLISIIKYILNKD